MTLSRRYYPCPPLLRLAPFPVHHSDCCTPSLSRRLGFGLAILTYCHRERVPGFGMRTYKKVGADPALLACYQRYQQFCSFLKLDWLFQIALVGIAVLGLTEDEWQWWLTVGIQLPYTLLWLPWGLIAVRRESSVLLGLLLVAACVQPPLYAVLLVTHRPPFEPPSPPPLPPLPPPLLPPVLPPPPLPPPPPPPPLLSPPLQLPSAFPSVASLPTAAAASSAFATVASTAFPTVASSAEASRSIRGGWRAIAASAIDATDVIDATGGGWGAIASSAAPTAGAAAATAGFGQTTNMGLGQTTPSLAQCTLRLRRSTFPFASIGLDLLYGIALLSRSLTVIFGVLAWRNFGKGLAVRVHRSRGDDDAPSALLLSQGQGSTSVPSEGSYMIHGYVMAHHDGVSGGVHRTGSCGSSYAAGGSSYRASSLVRLLSGGALSSHPSELRDDPNRDDPNRDDPASPGARSDLQPMLTLGSQASTRGSQTSEVRASLMGD